MKILLGMSGGLDSTYTALKLLRAGHTVEGAVLSMHGYTEVEAAEEAAKSLGIKLHKIDCKDEFNKTVVSDFISAYKNGKTPNPCIVCNSEVKFKKLHDFAKENGFDKVSTGHYADIVKIGDRYAVKRAKDFKKDQTYMLWRIPQDILKDLYFPLYEDNKDDIRKDAKDVGLSSADRPDSQEICFIPSGDYSGFIEENTEKSKTGNFIDKDGKILGEHKGIIHYTVGQRKGLGIALGKRMFVTDINPYDNTVTLADSDKMSSEVYISGIVFSGMAEPAVNSETEMLVKLRYLAPMINSKFIYLGVGRAKIVLDEPAKSVTPGQSAVFYKDDVLMAGGFIETSF